VPPLTLLALVACGGGGNSSTPGVLPTTTPAAATTPTPNPNPAASGDTFTYTGSLTQTFTLYGTPTPAPPPPPPPGGGPIPVGPSPTPTPVSTPAATATPWVSTNSQSVTQNVSISTGQSFAGQTGLTELTTHESDVSDLETTSVTSGTYLSYANDASRANGIDVTEIGTTSSDSNGVSLQTTTGSGNGIVDRLPNVANSQWSNSASRTETENDPDGQSTTTTYASDGTYQQQVNNPTGQGASANMAADGSGNFSAQLGVTVVGNPATLFSGFTIAPPLAGVIDLGFTLRSSGQPAAGQLQLPDWYPNTFPTLASDTYADEGTTTLPSSCNVAPAYQSVSVEKIAETRNRLDSVFGEYETDNATQYTSPSYGLLCVVVSDDLKDYYDYSGQTSELYGIAFNSTPLTETVVTETLALQSAKLVSASAARRTAQTFASQLFARPSLARARLILKAARAHSVRALHSRAHSASITRELR
jgi:hypothetical protein